MEAPISLSSPDSEHARKIQSTGVLISTSHQGFIGFNGTHITSPYFILSLCLSGSLRIMYDMQELVLEKNDLFLLLPEHIVRLTEYSEDYTHAWIIFDPSRFADSVLKFNDKDMDFFKQSPYCHLTDEQAKILLSIVGVTDYLVSLTEEELPGKHRLLEMQLTLAYMLYLSIRRKQDKQRKNSQTDRLYLQFCDLVVHHYKEERNVNYYAARLGYGARYFSKIFKNMSNGISPLEWIGQYVTAQAKHMIDSHPKQTIKETAYQLGFPSTASFCRYFKRVTGIYPQEYKSNKTD